MATDPVCSMTVSHDSEHHHEYEGDVYYFCSQGCHDKFSAKPESYLNKDNSNDEVEGDVDAIYTCPMHPEVEQQGPGSCPQCGMALELKGVPVAATKLNTLAQCIQRLCRMNRVNVQSAEWHWNHVPLP